MKAPSKTKVISFAALMLILMTVIGWVFWTQELQYASPTPVPTNFIDVKMGDTINLHSHLQLSANRCVLLHFFSFDCSCSRFNMKEFERLAHKYKNEIDFFVIIQSEDDDAVKKFQNKYDLNIPAILDRDGVLSDKCGIYATPQAVILDKNASVYFKGNYNKARFCTKKETRFAEMAIEHLLKNEPLPLFMQYALAEPYGCSLPSDEPESKNNWFNLF